LLAKWEAKASPGEHQARILAQRAFLRRVWLAGGHAGVIEAPNDVMPIVSVDRVPLRLWAEGEI